MANFVGIGGGEIPGWSFKTKDNNQTLYEIKEIDEYIVKLAKKENPKLLFIGLASKENEYYFKAIKNIYEGLGCSVEELKILEDTNIKEKIFSADIIYIGGGKTKFLLEKFNETNIDKCLVEAYNKGIIIAGFSAGCYSFFKYNYELLKGFGIINGISCVHYNEKSEEKRQEFYETIKKEALPGIALDNGVAIHYFENKFKIVKSLKNAKAYMITFDGEEYIKKELEEEIEYSI